MDIAYSLRDEMKNDLEIILYLESYEIAREFYQALCNMRWRKINVLSNEEQVVNKLKGTEPDVCSYTWRTAGAIISEIRCLNYPVNEDYITFYCTGYEGTVTEQVKKCFEKIGWEQYPWD